MQLIDYIKTHIEGTTELRLRKTAVSDRRRTVDFLFVSIKPLTQGQEENIRQLCARYAGNYFSVSVSFEKDTLSTTFIKNAVDRFIKTNHLSLTKRIKDFNVTQREKDFEVIFEMDSLTEKIVQDMGFLEELERYFDSISGIGVKCYTKSFPLKQDREQLKLKIQQYQQLQQSRELSRPKRFTDVKNIEAYIGKEVTARARYISDITEPMQRCTVAGKITSKKIVLSDKITSTICKLSISDKTATISAVLFAKKDVLKKFDALAVGDEIIVSASAQRSSYSGEIELKIFDISRCEIAGDSQQTKYINEVPLGYVTVHPKKISVEKQLALEEQSSAAPYYLREHDIVVLTVLTTGQRIFQDRIIKISAVKIVKGEFDQSFESLINPERVLEEDFSQRSGINETDLKNAPPIIDILPDLFKFCYGCVIVTQNEEITMGFIRYYANAAKYFFSNIVFDFEVLAKNFFSQGEYKGQRLSDYSALKVAEKLNIKIMSSASENESLALSRVLTRMAHLYDNLFQNT